MGKMGGTIIQDKRPPICTVQIGCFSASGAHRTSTFLVSLRWGSNRCPPPLPRSSPLPPPSLQPPLACPAYPGVLRGSEPTSPTEGWATLMCREGTGAGRPTFYVDNLPLIIMMSIM